jgi:hypothetical protein
VIKHGSTVERRNGPFEFISRVEEEYAEMKEKIHFLSNFYSTKINPNM